MYTTGDGSSWSPRKTLHQNRRHVPRHSSTFHSELKGLIGVLEIWATYACSTLYVHFNVMWDLALNSARFIYTQAAQDDLHSQTLLLTMGSAMPESALVQRLAGATLANGSLGG